VLSISRILRASQRENVTGVWECSGMCCSGSGHFRYRGYPPASLAGDAEVGTDRCRICDGTPHAKRVSTSGADCWGVPGAEHETDLTPLLGREHVRGMGIVLHGLSVASSYLKTRAKVHSSARWVGLCRVLWQQ
jgi:hypothetical protein